MFLWIVSFCNVSNRVPTTLYLRSLYTQISPMSRVHTHHTHKGKTHLTRLSVWSLATGSGPQPPEATCRDLWMEVVLKLAAVALVKVPQPMSIWVGRQIISFDNIWHGLIPFFLHWSNKAEQFFCFFWTLYMTHIILRWPNTKLSSSWLSFSFSKTAGSRNGTSRYRFQHSRCWAELSTMRWIIKLFAVNFLWWRSNIKLPPQKSNDSMGWFGVFRELSVPRSSWLWPECWRTTILIDHFAEEVPSRDMVWKHPNANPTLQMSPSLKQRQEKNDLKCK